MPKTLIKRIIANAMFAAFIGGMASAPASAEMQVTMSTSATLAVGAKLPDEATFDIGEGETVRVMKAGKTYELAGPYTGTLDNYRSTCAWWQEVLGKCSKRRPDAGTVPGATRSIAPE
jgi:hypothetical protein